MYGAVFVTWPGTHPAELSDRERDHLTAACDRLALRLERAAEEGHPVRPEPDLLAPASAATVAGTLGAVEAVRMVARLPYGLCALDLHGRISFANAAAAELLGLPVSALLGTAAVGVPAVAERPGLRGPLPGRADQPAGDVVRGAAPAAGLAVVPAVSQYERAECADLPGAGGGGDRPHRRSGPRTRGSRLVTISHVLSLAGALTEAVGVQDVVQLVADEIAPAVGSQALVAARLAGAAGCMCSGTAAIRTRMSWSGSTGCRSPRRPPATHALTQRCARLLRVPPAAGAPLSGAASRRPTPWRPGRICR